MILLTMSRKALFTALFSMWGTEGWMWWHWSLKTAVYGFSASINHISCSGSVNDPLIVFNTIAFSLNEPIKHKTAKHHPMACPV